MNVYDTVNKLASEIRQSEEYANYKMAKQALNLNTALKEKMAEFEKTRYEVQLEMMQTGKNDEEKYKRMQDLYAVYDYDIVRLSAIRTIAKVTAEHYVRCYIEEKKLRFSDEKIKHIVDDDKDLDELAKKYPSNIELCKKYLKKLNNESVKIEEDKDSESSLYIAISNKILIANIAKSYTRIQTIAHECLHSVQDRKLLIFNFIFSNIYLLYFAVICLLAIFKMIPNKILFISIYLILSMVYYVVRVYLENDAMIKARYLAKEYMEEEKISTPEEINKIVKGFDRINDLGIKVTNYKFFLNIMIKFLIFIIICVIR